MNYLYIAIFIFFLLVIIVSIMGSRSKKKISTNKIVEQMDEPDDTDKYDLYESIYDFMNKQNKYINSLG